MNVNLGEADYLYITVLLLMKDENLMIHYQLANCFCNIFALTGIFETWNWPDLFQICSEHRWYLYLLLWSVIGLRKEDILESNWYQRILKVSHRNHVTKINQSEHNTTVILFFTIKRITQITGAYWKWAWRVFEKKFMAKTNGKMKATSIQNKVDR